MATSNRYKYWGNWGLPIRGAFGKLTTVQVVTLGAVRATVKALRWFARARALRWRANVKRLGR